MTRQHRSPQLHLSPRRSKRPNNVRPNPRLLKRRSFWQLQGFADKELRRVESGGDIWYLAEEVRDLISPKNIRRQLNNLPEAWKRVVNVNESWIAKSYTTGNPNWVVINTKAVLKIAVR